MRLSSLALLCVVLMNCRESVQAHHAPFIYDTETEYVVSGVVEAFDWVQPHTWVSFRVKEPEAQAGLWMLEGMNPLYLGHRGWTEYSLQPGQAIDVAFFPRRDGSRKGMFLRAIYADGSIKVMALNNKNEVR